MSISSSLSNAVSGLSAAGRTAEVISANVANSNTEGYGRRDVSLAASGLGGGVRVLGVNRVVNDVALADRRLADASLGSSSVALDFFTRMETAIGMPGEPGTLPTAIASFETSLIASSGNPNSDAFLATVLSSAKSVTESIQSVASEIQAVRQDADAMIGSQVGQINTALDNIHALNQDIRRLTATGGDVNGLIDQRQQQIDRISEFIPVKEAQRDYNQIALMTETGATLVDSKAATLVFETTPIITPDMTLSSGALSSLTIENAATSLGSALQSISGGALAANFQLRDELAPSAQVQIDAIARDLIERFSGPDADHTLAVGQAGLFTDAGANFDPLAQEGVSSRLSVSDVIDPAAGGQLSKIRDGIGSLASGPVGENGILLSLRSALTQPGIPASGTFGSAGSYSEIGSDFLSGFSVLRQSTEATQAFNTARVTTLKDIEQQDGVSTDDELQRLLLVEQAYAANARVIQTVDEMIQSLLRI